LTSSLDLILFESMDFGNWLSLITIVFPFLILIFFGTVISFNNCSRCDCKFILL